jgi:hypothetical protein
LMANGRTDPPDHSRRSPFGAQRPPRPFGWLPFVVELKKQQPPQRGLTATNDDHGQNTGAAATSPVPNHHRTPQVITNCELGEALGPWHDLAGVVIVDLVRPSRPAVHLSGRVAPAAQKITRPCRVVCRSSALGVPRCVLGNEGRPRDQGCRWLSSGFAADSGQEEARRKIAGVLPGVRAPVSSRHDAGFDDIQPIKQPRYLLPRAQSNRRRSLLGHPT